MRGGFVLIETARFEENYPMRARPTSSLLLVIRNVLFAASLFLENLFLECNP